MTNAELAAEYKRLDAIMQAKCREWVELNAKLTALDAEISQTETDRHEIYTAINRQAGVAQAAGLLR